MRTTGDNRTIFIFMRKLQGTIVSDKMQKTVVVQIDRLRRHEKYLKYFRVSKRYKAHDEKGEYHTGDRVVIEETRPLSREKRWRVVECIARATAANGSESAESGG